jgi:hypothetical protein
VTAMHRIEGPAVERNFSLMIGSRHA